MTVSKRKSEKEKRKERKKKEPQALGTAIAGSAWGCKPAANSPVQGLAQPQPTEGSCGWTTTGPDRLGQLLRLFPGAPTARPLHWEQLHPAPGMQGG